MSTCRVTDSSLRFTTPIGEAPRLLRLLAFEGRDGGLDVPRTRWRRKIVRAAAVGHRCGIGALLGRSVHAGEGARGEAELIGPERAWPRTPTTWTNTSSLLASEPLIQDLVYLAQAGAATPRLQVVTLAAAMVQAAVEGDVPESLVRDVVETCLAGARETDSGGEKPNYSGSTPGCAPPVRQNGLRIHDARYCLVSLRSITWVALASWSVPLHPASQR